MRYTPEQQEAITRRHGELLLDAGAGSGKTSVLVERFVRSLTEDGVGVGQILAITFTEKAASELRERIRRALREAGEHDAARATEEAWISTIHGFCARLLRAHALRAGVDPEFSVLDELESAALAREAFDAALRAWAFTPAGAELISAHGPASLREAVLGVHAELRARGMSEPSLPPAPPPPDPLELRAACAQVTTAAAAALRELGASAKNTSRVLGAIALLEGVRAALSVEMPWPGDLLKLRLPAGADALRSHTCEEYRAALAELEALAGSAAASVARNAIEALLREYSSRYTELKRERGALDFSDLELSARELLRDHELGSRYRERFARVMVDEVQDVNQVQMELIDLVAGASLVMVGDAQQSIYGFRHAEPELFEQRGRRLAAIGARKPLMTNFRSRPQILRVLNRAFAEALGERFMELAAGRDADAGAAAGAEPLVELLIANRVSDTGVNDDPSTEQLAAPWRVAEARALAGRVAELIAAGVASAGEVVVLMRASTDMDLYEQALLDAGLPTYVIGSRGFWAQPQVVQLVSYLRALANPLEQEAYYAVLASPLCGLSLDGLVLLAAGARERLGEADRVLLERFEAWFDGEREAAAWLGPERLLDRALAHNGYELHVAGLADARRRLANIRKLMRLARQWQATGGSDLRGFVEQLRVRAQGADSARESEAPVQAEALDAVRLMTIHRSKGLEFPVVCVADLGRGVATRPRPLVRIGRDGRRLGLCVRRPGDGEKVCVLDHVALSQEEREREAQEERRLFYVAMTRARERLIVSGATRLEPWGARVPMDWVGRALVPEIESRALEAASAFASGHAPAPFVTEDGVRVRFVAADQACPPSAGRATPPPPAAPAPPPPPEQPAPTADPQTALAVTAAAIPSPNTEAAPRTLSYTALAGFARCPYRFYLQHIVGLPELPGLGEPGELPEPQGAPGRQQTRARAGAPSAAVRGTLIHELLASIDLRAPAIGEGVSADVRALVAGLIGSAGFARIAALRGPRREQRFAFTVEGTLITGVFDLVAQDGPGRLLVVDYKSDRLDGADPTRLVEAHYELQRMVYALAALKIGARAVEVMHLFLEAPDEPVSREFTAGDAPALEEQLAARVREVAAGCLSGFRVSERPGRRVCAGCPARGGLCSYPLELTLG